MTCYAPTDFETTRNTYKNTPLLVMGGDDYELFLRGTITKIIVWRADFPSSPSGAFPKPFQGLPKAFPRGGGGRLGPEGGGGLDRPPPPSPWVSKMTTKVFALRFFIHVLIKSNIFVLWKGGGLTPPESFQKL